MQLANLSSRSPHLIQALEALALNNKSADIAEELLDELIGINVLVAKRFTNESTANGILEAYYLTIGCISLGIAQANIPDTPESKLTFLLNHGAEYVFQMGFRHIKELASLPYVPYVSEFEQDPYIQQRNIKALFSEICRAEPSQPWYGNDTFNRELMDRTANQKMVDCAKWLRKNNDSAPVKDSELDANAIIAIAIIFGIQGDGRIVARAGQKEIENLISRVRKEPPDIDTALNKLLVKIPEDYQSLMQAHIEKYRSTIIKKILSKAKVSKVVTEIQDCYAGSELDIDYP